MGFTPVNGNKSLHPESRSSKGEKVKKSVKMLAKIPNPRPLHIVNVSQIQPLQPNPFAYAQQRGRANPPLDMCFLKKPARRPPSRPREHIDNLREVPTLYPTNAEFANPDLYLSSLQEFEKYGMVKVVPPEHWFPPLALDTELFTFRTIHQLVNKNVGDTELREEFNAALKYFHGKTSKKSISSFKIPLIHKRPLNMYLLHRCVQLRGGLEVVSRKKMWQQIGRELGYSGKIMSSLSTSLRNSYQKLLMPFDEYLQQNGVDLSSSPRLVRYKISPDTEPKEGEIKLPIGIIVTMDCSSPDWTPERFPEISNSLTPRLSRPPPQWTQGNYSPLNSAEQDASYNLKQFQIKADSFQSTYFRGNVSEEDIEKEYWRLLNTPGECLDVEYGYSMTCASGFSHDWKNPWNFDRISMSDGSYLRYIDNDMMARPRLDVGMLFASKAWSSEPYFGTKLSISHLGATRTWYSTAPSAFVNMFDTVHMRCNELMVTPSQLAKRDIPCYVADQNPGEIIVIFPKSWHSHFNHGFNLNEAVNFLSREWLDSGKEADQGYKDYKLPAPFPLDELICVTAGSDNCDMLVRIVKELQELYRREKAYTEKFPQIRDTRFERQVCVRTNQTMVLSWVFTPEGPTNPGYAAGGMLHAAYDDVDEYFGNLIDTIFMKLRHSKEYLTKVCNSLMKQQRLPKQELESLIDQGPTSSRCELVKKFLGQQIEESAALAAKCRVDGKQTLEWVGQMLEEYKKLICITPELESLASAENEHEQYLRDLVAVIEGTKLESFETLLARGEGVSVFSGVVNALYLWRNKIAWANQVSEMLSSQPVVYLGQLDGLINEARQLGIPPQAAFYKHLEEKKQAGLAFHARAEQLAFHGQVDPKELDFVLEQASSVPIAEQVYVRLQLYKSIHSMVEATSNMEVSKRPRLSAAAQYRVVNPQIGEAVVECESWIVFFGNPDQLFAQVEAAAANGQCPLCYQVSLQSLMAMLARLDHLRVIPDNFEAWLRCRQVLTELSSQDPARLQRYGFV